MNIYLNKFNTRTFDHCHWFSKETWKNIVVLIWLLLLWQVPSLNEPQRTW